jgi:hypothetical protein
VKLCINHQHVTFFGPRHAWYLVAEAVLSESLHCSESDHRKRRNEARLNQRFEEKKLGARINGMLMKNSYVLSRLAQVRVTGPHVMASFEAKTISCITHKRVQ